MLRLIDFWHLVRKFAAAAAELAGPTRRAKCLLARWRFLLLNRDEARETILEALHASGSEQVQVVESKRSRQGRAGDRRQIYEELRKNAARCCCTPVSGHPEPQRCSRSR